MAVTNYLSVNGQIRSEHRSGEAHSRDYGLDPLGNVVSVHQDGSQIAESSYSGWGNPVGASNMDSYRFTWVGAWGYRQTKAEWSSAYMRARHYSLNDGAWTTRDLLWPNELPYGYVSGRAMSAVDPSGAFVIPLACAAACLVTAGCAAGVWIACGELWGEEPEFGDCVKDYIQSLPPISQIGCGAGLGGCLVCIARELRAIVNYINRRLTPCDRLYISYKVACGLLPGQCTELDSCEGLFIKMAAYGSCAAQRRLWKIKCNKCYATQTHQDQIDQNTKVFSNCLAIATRKGCVYQAMQRIGETAKNIPNHGNLPPWMRQIPGKGWYD